MMSWVLKISIPTLVFVFTSPAMAYGNCDSFMNSMSDECKENRRIEARIKMLQERARKRKLRRNKKSYKKASHKPYRYSNNSRRTSNKIAPKHYQLKNWNVRTQPSLRRSQVIETAGQRDYKLMTKKLANGKKALVTSSNGVWYALTCSTCDEPVWINRKALIRKEAPPVRQRETFADDHKPVVTAKKQPIRKASEKRKPNNPSVKIHKPKKVAEKKKDSVDSIIGDIDFLGFGEAKNPTKKNKKPIAKKEIVEKKAPQVSLSKAEKAQEKLNKLKSKAYKAEIAALAAEEQAKKVKNSNLAPTAKREATQKRLAAQKASQDLKKAGKELFNINKETSKKKGLSRGLLANTKKHSKPKQLASPKKMKTVGQAKKNFKQFKDKAYHAKLAEVEAKFQAQKSKTVADKATKKMEAQSLLSDLKKSKEKYRAAKERATKAYEDLEKTKKNSKKNPYFFQLSEKKKARIAKEQLSNKEKASKRAIEEMKQAGKKYEAAKEKAFANKVSKEILSKKGSLFPELDKAEENYRAANRKALKARADLDKTKADSKKKGSRPNNKRARLAKEQIPQKEKASKEAYNQMAEALEALEKTKKKIKDDLVQKKLAAKKDSGKAKEATDNYKASEEEMNVAYKGLLNAEKEEEKRKALAEQKRLAQEAKEKERQDALAQQKANEKAKQDALAKEKAKALADKKAKEKKEQELADKKAKEKAKKEALAKKKEEEKKKKELAEKRKEKSFEEKHKRKAFCVTGEEQLKNSPIWKKLRGYNPYAAPLYGKKMWHTITVDFKRNSKKGKFVANISGFKFNKTWTGIMEICYKRGRVYAKSSLFDNLYLKPHQRTFSINMKDPEVRGYGPVELTRQVER